MKSYVERFLTGDPYDFKKGKDLVNAKCLNRKAVHEFVTAVVTPQRKPHYTKEEIRWLYYFAEKHGFHLLRYVKHYR